MSAPAETRDEGLLRAIGPAGLTASVVNAVVGGGIFALPAAIALELGPSGPLAFVLGGILIGLVTASIASVGGRVAQSGGTWAYAEAAFGPFAGYLTGVLFLLTSVLASASLAAGLVDSVSGLDPMLARPEMRVAELVLLYAVLVGVNLRGVRAGTGVISGLAVIKFLALLLFVVLGVSVVRAENFVVRELPTAAHVGRSTILALFALCGMETALGASGEVRDPVRTIPRALFAATVLVVLTYLAIQVVAQGVLGSELASATAPLADSVARVSPVWKSVILGAGAVSMAGWLVGDLLGTSRMVFAFGRMGVLPRFLTIVHEKRRVPYWAVVCYATIAFVLAMFGTFTTLAVLSSVGTILLYLSCCGAACALQERRIVPLLAIAALLAMLFSCTSAELLSIGAVMAAAGVWYWMTSRWRRAARMTDPGKRSP
ncbi:MAG TPA: APC family permease [Planctomycetota bacterium]|nr:APC family permease [Planctomycetota bacterium]